MSVSTPIPSSVTCFKNGLSHLTFPINFRPGLSPVKIGPLTATTVNGSISVIPDDTNLKIYSITSENNLMIKVHYKLENQDQDGKANFSYICPGIKWKPNYLVKVSNNNEEKTLTIGGRATIGNPNFCFKISPLGGNQLNVTGALSAWVPGFLGTHRF